MSYRIGIDIGGTFTDFAMLKGQDLILHKNLSTPEDRSLGVIQGLERLAELEGKSLAQLLGQVDAIIHGTTVADNTLIEMNGACTGLLTTAGLSRRTGTAPGLTRKTSGTCASPPPIPIIPRRRRLGVPERIRFDGSVHTPLDEDAARVAIRRLAKQGVESVAICTLFSFANPVHELRLAELVAEEMPDAYISLSHQVLPKSPEFERVSTTAVNGYVGPRVSQYINRLSERLQECGYQSPPAADAVQRWRDDAGVPGEQPDSRAGFRSRRRRDRQRRHRQGQGRDGTVMRRYGRHQLRRLGDPQRHGPGTIRLELAPPLSGGDAHGAGRNTRRWWWLHLQRRVRHAARRPGERRRRARPGLLRPRRHSCPRSPTRSWYWACCPMNRTSPAAASD